MKKKIRNNVFETNSSSMHSLSIRPHCDTIPMVIKTISFGQYGWEMDNYDCVDEKLSYVITAIQYFCDDSPKSYCTSDDNKDQIINDLLDWIENNKYFQWLHEMVQDFTGSDFEVNLLSDEWNMMGYIDHESVYLLNEYGLWSNDEKTFKDNMKEFIFNGGYMLITDNDNH